MFEFKLILYELSTSWPLITAFLILLFILGCILYIGIKNFKVRDGKIKIYGLLLGLEEKDILAISSAIVRAFLIIFSLIVYQNNINMYLVMIGIISALLIVFSLKNVVYEIINTVALIAIIYFSNQLSNYLINIENSNAVMLIKIVLICFGILYTTYIFLKEIEDITSNHENINE